YNF
ncbi:unnamed protein product, partial [Callosobruchus maculatus]